MVKLEKKDIKGMKGYDSTTAIYGEDGFWTITKKTTQGITSNNILWYFRSLSVKSMDTDLSRAQETCLYSVLSELKECNYDLFSVDDFKGEEWEETIN